MKTSSNRWHETGKSWLNQTFSANIRIELEYCNRTTVRSTHRYISFAVRYDCFNGDFFSYYHSRVFARDEQKIYIVFFMLPNSKNGTHKYTHAIIIINRSLVQIQIYVMVYYYLKISWVMLIRAWNVSS